MTSFPDLIAKPWFQFLVWRETRRRVKSAKCIANLPENGIRIDSERPKTRPMPRKSSCKSHQRKDLRSKRSGFSNSKVSFTGTKFSKMTSPGKSTTTCSTIRRKCGRITTDITVAEWRQKWMWESSLPSRFRSSPWSNITRPGRTTRRPSSTWWQCQNTEFKRQKSPKPMAR